MATADTAVMTSSSTAPSTAPSGKALLAVAAFLALCALPLLSEQMMSWVRGGTGGEGVFAYLAAWSAVVSLGMIAIGAATVTAVAADAVRHMVLTLAAQPRVG